MDSYDAEILELELDRLRSRIDHLEQENRDLNCQLCEKDARIFELEGALEMMRRDLRRVEDGADLDHAKREGRKAIGGYW